MSSSKKMSDTEGVAPINSFEELYLKIHIYSTRNFFIFLNHYDLIFFKYINVGWAALEGAKIALRESRRNSFLR